MKILILNQVFYPDPAATAQHVSDLARFLTAKGCEVTVLCDRRGYEKRNVVHSAQENYHGINVQRVWSTRWGKTYLRGRILDALSLHFFLAIKLLGVPKQDVVLTFTSPPLVGFLGALFCLFKGGRLVQWLMDLNLETAVEVGYLKRNSFTVRVLKWIFRFVLKRSSSVVVLDRWMKERAQSFGADKESICIVPPWPVHRSPEANLSKEENLFAKEFNLQDKFVILYSGNHSIVHPLDTILDAAVLLRDREDIKFVFIGNGLRVRDVTEKINEEGLTNVLQLPIQPRERLKETLSCADLHVVIMGSRISGLVHPSKIYGILATGKPYLYIGPENSHGVDLLRSCPYGFHVEHGKPTEVLEVVGKVHSLSAKELADFQEHNIRLAQGYTAEKSLGVFAKSVLHLEQKKGPITGLQPETAPLGL